MAYLAYDPIRLGFLRAMVRDALRELEQFSLSDAEAATAMQTIRAARAALADGWLPTIDRVLASTALTRAEAVDLGDTLVDATAYEMAASRGWSVAPDLLPSVGRVMTPGEVAALAHRLDDSDVSMVLDSADERRWLHEQLQIIAAHPVLAQVFRDELAHWADLCNALGLRLATERNAVAIGVGSEATQREIAALDDDFAALAAIRRVHPDDRCQAVVPDDLDRMQPYAAAMLISHLGLDAQTLADLTDRLLRQWHNMAPIDAGFELSRWADQELSGPNTADILFATLLQTPGAPTAYVLRSMDDPASMWLTADDPELTAEVARVGTSRANIDLAKAGEVIQAWFAAMQTDEFVARTLMMDGAAPDYRAAMAEVIAPYLVEMAPSSTAWGNTDDDIRWRKNALAMLVESSTAIASLTANATRITVPLARDTGSAPVDDPRVVVLEQLAEVAGLLNQLAVEGSVERAEDGQALCNLAGLLVGIGSAWAGPMTSLTTTLVTAPVITLVADQLDVPTDTEAARATGNRQLQLTLVGLQAGAVRAFWLSLQDDAVEPPPVVDDEADDPAVRFTNDFNAWLASVKKAIGDERVHHIRDIVNAIGSGWQSGTSVGGPH